MWSPLFPKNDKAYAGGNRTLDQERIRQQEREVSEVLFNKGLFAFTDDSKFQPSLPTVAYFDIVLSTREEIWHVLQHISECILFVFS